MTASTVPHALAEALRGDTALPFVTYAGPAGERTELSLRTFENNVAKTANLLRDDADAEPGTRVALHLPLHWQTAVWLAACALVGATAVPGGRPEDCDVSVVAPAGLGLPRAPLALATALHPFGMPFTDALPDGLLDAAVEVRAHGDRFAPSPYVEPTTDWIALPGSTLTQADALAAAADLARDLGLVAGGRLLVARALDETSVLALVAVPLVVLGSVVLLTDPAADVAAVTDAERCTAVLR